MADQNVTLDFSKSVPVQGQSSQGQSPQAQSSQAVTLDFSKAQPTTVSMTGPQGEKEQVPAENVAAKRQQNFAVASENPGVQKMVTPDGRITYALPGEVDRFKQSGHTLIHPDGNFQVQPLPGEDSTDTMQRAVNVGRALGPQLQRSMQAEQNWWTSKEGLSDEAAGLMNVGTAGAETIATLAGGSGAQQAARAGLAAVGENAEIQMLKSSPRLYAERLIKYDAPKYVRQLAQSAAKHPVQTAGAVGSLVGGMDVAWHWLTKH